jgi:hypothetical protein
MKKLVFLFAMVFAVSMAMGQSNSSTVDQTGNNQNALVIQSGSSNSSDVDQTSPAGSVNNATVNQTGNSNTADVDQVQQNSVVGANNATLTQIGNSNNGTQTQVGTWTGYMNATMLQNGSNNTGTQIQSSYNETATMTQLQDGNTGIQNQSGNYVSAAMTQSGLNNYGNQLQSGLNNSMTLSQTGNSNESYQTQSGGTWNPPGGHRAVTTILGDDNYTSQQQSGTTSNNASIDQTANSSSAEQTQTGSYNQATITQLGQWPAGAVIHETAIQIQTGDEHDAEISQITDSGNGGSSTTQTQTGYNQFAFAGQYSWNSTIIQTQNGSSRNWAEAYQAGNNNYVRQIQNGEGNRARVDEQTGGWTQGNTAIQEQTGRWNNALIEQYDVNGAKSWPGGNGNTAEIYQTGDDNWAGDGYGAATEYGIRQWGDDNTAIVTQNDVANKSQVLQVGIGNDVNVSQGGGTGLFGAFGTYWNVSNVDQTGNYNNATVTQTYVP